jgi:rSAM/selenodomain-associated transferase 2
MEASVSVIVPALNESLRIARAINSAFSAGAHEVIVVDGGSMDDTLQRAEQAGALVRSSPPGRAVQQNAGAALARGNVLLFLHADNWLGSETIQQIKQHCRSRTRVAGAFRQSIDAVGMSYRVLERGNALRASWFGRPYGDQGIFVDRQLFVEVGCFAEVPLMEDLLIMQQIRHHVRPTLLAGPIHVDARRWQQGGIVRQTLRNWSLLGAHTFGCSPARLARFYPSHQTPVQATDNDKGEQRDANCCSPASSTLSGMRY